MKLRAQEKVPDKYIFPKTKKICPNQFYQPTSSTNQIWKQEIMRKNMTNLEDMKSAISKTSLNLYISLARSKNISLSYLEKSWNFANTWGDKSRLTSNLIGKINHRRAQFNLALKSEQGDVPGWVLVVLMTTGLVTGIWTVAQPRLSSILKNSLDNMNSIR